jgi:hypothetical protein
MVREAIYRYHKSADAGRAREELEGEIQARGIVRAVAEQMLGRLDEYVAWCQQTALTVATHRYRVNHDLGSGVVLGGEVSRIDILPGGYRGVMLSSPDARWRTQLRMPLIQIALARAFARPEAEFSVGFQELNGGNLQGETFGEERRREANDMAHELARRIAAEASRLGAV